MKSQNSLLLISLLLIPILMNTNSGIASNGDSDQNVSDPLYNLDQYLSTFKHNFKTS